MGSKMVKAVLWVTACLLSVGCAGAQVTQYNVGVWYPAAADIVYAMHKGVFESYLNQAVGTSLNVRFKVIVVDMDEDTLAEKLIDENKLDFFFSMVGRIVCVQRAFDWILLATARNRGLGTEVGAHSTLMYSLKSNTAIKNVEDVKGKRIGVTHIDSSSYYLAKEILADHGVDMFRDPSQIVFYGGGFEDQLSHVLTENIDVGFTNGIYLFLKFPQQIPNLVFHNLLNATYESAKYPLPTSAPLTPAFTLACSQQIPFTVKKAVLTALMNLDPASPQALISSLSNFTPAASLFDVRASMEHANLFDPHGRCYSPFEDPAEIMVCPRGFVLDTAKGLERRCEFNRLTCPAGYPCYCSPCVPSIYLTIFPAEVVLGLATTLFGLNLAVVVCWGFGIELGYCLRRPAHALAKKTEAALLQRRLSLSAPRRAKS